MLSPSNFVDFGRAVAANAPEAEDLRRRLAQVLPPAAMVDLAIAIASARVFPALKRGLGRAQSCALVQVKVPGATPVAAHQVTASA